MNYLLFLGKSNSFILAYELQTNFLPIIFTMPPNVDIGGHHIVLLKTVANETHTTIPKRKLKQIKQSKTSTY